ncbi:MULTISPECIES: ATP-binding protein [Microbispora]|uniref:ATP-binding protein n=1 Tax=Microbispora TaxID=2005 RepID=UPI0034058D55
MGSAVAAQRLGRRPRPQRRRRHPGGGVPVRTGGHSAGTRSDASYGTWRWEFHEVNRSVSAAREWARGLLAGQVAASVLDDVLLLLSEVVTNAVAHTDSGRAADGRVVVWMVRTPAAVHVEVVDGGSVTSTPVMRVPDAGDDGARGSVARGSARRRLGRPSGRRRGIGMVPGGCAPMTQARMSVTCCGRSGEHVAAVPLMHDVSASA